MATAPDHKNPAVPSRRAEIFGTFRALTGHGSITTKPPAPYDPLKTWQRSRVQEYSR